MGFQMDMRECYVLLFINQALECKKKEKQKVARRRTLWIEADTCTACCWGVAQPPPLLLWKV